VAPYPPNILITDDDRGFRETLQGVFEPRYRTLLAADGEQALDIVRNQDVHLLLLDMHMPKLTGLEVLRLVKQIKSVLPCILLSADADESVVREAQRLQAYSVLSKPVTRQRITNSVEQAMQHYFRAG
jgi:CheY-like chemotaxis protein